MAIRGPEVVRWIHLEDASAVTCLDVATWAEGRARAVSPVETMGKPGKPVENPGKIMENPGKMMENHGK